MSYEVVWDPVALNFLRKLEKEIAKRIVQKIEEEIKLEPERFVEKLVWEDFYKIRIGTYRLFVDLTYNPNKLYIRTIKHRKNAYKK